MSLSLVKSDAVRDEVIYRCLNVACARPLPRRVNFCPYCGMGQGMAVQSAGTPPATVTLDKGAAIETAEAAGAVAGSPGAAAPAPSPSMGQRGADDGEMFMSAGTATAYEDAASIAAAAYAAVASAAAAAAAHADAAPSAARHTLDTPARGATANANSNATANAAASARVSAAPPTPAAPPPQPRPVRLRWWLLAFAALLLVWFNQRATPARIERRVEQAMALAAACHANEAQAALIALKGDGASARQLARVQSALDGADQACRGDGRRGRGGAKKPAVRPAAQQSQSVRNLLADARGAIARGNYRAAADKMEVCVAMLDADTRECSELKTRAEALDAQRQRCQADGRQWLGGICR